jgi:hypothetical protein
MLNWKGCGRKWPWPNLRHCSGIYLEEVRNMTEDLRIVGVLAKIWTGQPPNTS